MKDKKTEMFFDTARWESILDKAYMKGIDKDMLEELCTPSQRLRLYEAVTNGNYAIAPPHIAEIPKEDGSMREVYVNEPIDRIFLSLYNEILFEMFPDAIHPNCKSYQKGIGCGKIVTEISDIISKTNGVAGYKADLSKYFDSVPLEIVEETLKKFYTESPLDDIIWDYYRNDLVFDKENNLIQRYGSLKQGCAVASFLANTTLYDVDEAISKLDVLYVRYSDDIMILGKEADKGMAILREMLDEKGLTLNPKKVEKIERGKWVTFLGFNINGKDITFSRKTIKKFQKEIEERMWGAKSTEGMIHSVNKYLYHGYVKNQRDFGFGTYFLPTVNNKHDLAQLDHFIKDAIRAVDSGKRRIGGLGENRELREGTIQRGKGKNVRGNREKWRDKYGTDFIDGYYTLPCMREAMRCGKSVYETMVNSAL